MLNINIITDLSPEIDNGYINVYGPFFDHKQQYNDIDSIIGGTILHQCPSRKDLVDLLNYFYKKMRKGGKLTITYYDIHSIAKLIETKATTINIIENMIFGVKHQNKILLTTSEIQQALSSVGFTIELVTTVFNEPICTILASK